MAISRQKEAQSRDYALLLSDDFKGSFKYTVLSRTFHMHNLDDEHPTRPGFEPSTGEFGRPVEQSFISLFWYLVFSDGNFGR